MRVKLATSRLLAGLILLGFTVCSWAESWTTQREHLTRSILEDVRETSDYTGRTNLNPRVITALRKVPRHRFVPEGTEAAAYYNRPLPIGAGQTISQPFIVALMTDLLEPQPQHNVLEIGTGSGYQTAVLAELVDEVHSIEIIETLGTAARDRLLKLRYFNVHVHIGDGYWGWKQAAPYDSIIVTAASEKVPPALLAQLKPGGRLVIPIGPEHGFQQLVLVEKSAQGLITQQNILPVQFVPFTGRH